MATYEQQTLAIAEDAQSSAPVSHVSRHPLPGSDEALAMTVGSGRQLSMLLDQSSRLGAFSRILLESSHWTSSAEYCYVWNRLDTRFGCSAFQLTPLAQSTEDNGCLLWQTPVADDSVDREKGKINSRGEPKLSVQVKLWRTPDASMTSGGANGADRLKQGHAMGLHDRANTPKLWPTPTERDWKSASHGNQGNARPLSEVAGMNGSGSLNPRFVEQLQGFPIDVVPQQAFPFFEAIAAVTVATQCEFLRAKPV